MPGSDPGFPKQLKSSDFELRPVGPHLSDRRVNRVRMNTPRLLLIHWN
jgi:hypothetical protein